MFKTVTHAYKITFHFGPKKRSIDQNRKGTLIRFVVNKLRQHFSDIPRYKL